jgi:hypothetical protein
VSNSDQLFLIVSAIMIIDKNRSPGFGHWKTLMKIRSFPVWST